MDFQQKTTKNKMSQLHPHSNVLSSGTCVETTGLVFFFPAHPAGPTQTWSETEETYDSSRRDLPLIGNVLQAGSFWVRFFLFKDGVKR